MTWAFLFEEDVAVGSRSIKVEAFAEANQIGLRFDGFPSSAPLHVSTKDGIPSDQVLEILQAKLGLSQREGGELWQALMKKDFRMRFPSEQDTAKEWESGSEEWVDSRTAREGLRACLADKQRPNRQKYAEVARIGYSYLYANGCFYFHEAAFAGYWLNSSSRLLYRLPASAREGEKFQNFLADRLQLNREDTAFAWLLSGIESRVVTHAPKVRPHLFSFYDKATNVLYVNNKPGRMLKLDGANVVEVDNGTDEVLFLWNDKWREWDFDGTTPSGDIWRELLHSRFSVDTSGDQSLTREELFQVLDVHDQLILFREIVPHRPIEAHVGPWGTGKTSAGYLVGLALVGPEFQVIGAEEQKEDAIIAYITNNFYGVLDNADEKVKWLPDLLARTATGQSIPRRKLYTTNELIEYPVDIVLTITARATPWARPDVISRLLLLPFKRPELFVSDEELKQEIIANRQGLLSALVLRANESIARLKIALDVPVRSPSRLAGFYAFGMKVSRNPESFASAYKKLGVAQESLTYEEQETLLMLLRELIEAELTSNGTLDDSGFKWTAPRAASALFGELTAMAKEKSLRLDVKTANGLGMVLRNIESTLADVGIKFKMIRKAKANLWTFSLDQKE